jgi:acetolactate decarboxylase
MATVWQNAPAIRLEEGGFDGITSVAELAAHGDFGLGAFERLEGEMIGFDGAFHMIGADSRARVASGSDRLAFCMVTAFEGSPEPLPPGTSKDGLPRILDAALGNEGGFCAIRLEGEFTSLRTRCFPLQSEPYPPLADVTASQPEYSYERIEGTMAGFQAPPYLGRMTPPGCHLHFVSADRTIGGHVISFEDASATIAADAVEGLEIRFPAG